MSNSKTLLKGTFILTMTGFVSKIMGFFYRIFLSRTLGAEGMGIYQLIFPLYALCYAITISGLQTVLSRSISSGLALNRKKDARDSLLTGVILSTLLSLLISSFVFYFARPICLYFLQDVRCMPLLQILAFCVTPGTLHACLFSWYYAQKKTGLPAFCQLAEQCARISSSFFLYRYLTRFHLQITPVVAVIGILIGESISAFIALIAISLNFQKAGYRPGMLQNFKLHSRNLLIPALPLTANRLLLTLLSGIETILIPSRLLSAGIDSKTAMEIYGIVTGMALPFILFPSAVTNSAAVMLLPSIAEKQARCDQEEIAKTIEHTIKYCFLLGILFTGIFYFFGEEAGILLFKNEYAGRFIKTLSFICPFLYLTTTFNSILNGLGKTAFCFFQTLAALLLRIFFVYFFIPRYGISAYLWGLLASELFLTLLSFFYLFHTVPFTFSLWRWVGKPCLCLFISGGIGLFVYSLKSSIFCHSQFLPFCFAAASMGAFYLLLLYLSGELQIPQELLRKLDK